MGLLTHSNLFLFAECMLQKTAYLTPNFWSRQKLFILLPIKLFNNLSFNLLTIFTKIEIFFPVVQSRYLLCQNCNLKSLAFNRSQPYLIFCLFILLIIFLVQLLELIVLYQFKQLSILLLSYSTSLCSNLQLNHNDFLYFLVFFLIHKLKDLKNIY